MGGKAVLAFSGGLDTSVVARMLQDRGMDVVTVTVDVGQGGDYRRVAAKSRRLGAVKHRHIDARAEFATRYVIPAIKANALYQGKYCLATALARPLIAVKLLEVARKEGAKALAHGCSGKGNDQVRFDNALRAGGKLPIIAPIRELDLDRPAELEYAAEHGIAIDKVAKRYSIDQNLWGRAIEGGDLEDPYSEPRDDAFAWVRTRNLPAKPTYIVVRFERGVPVAVDGKRMRPADLVAYMNKKAGAAGVGIVDHIEDRVVGIKSREVYETPGALCLIEAHADLEKMVHTSHQSRFKRSADAEWAQLAYTGLWDDPLREDLDSLIESSQSAVTGDVRLRLLQGGMRVVGRRSPRSLYSRKAATYGPGSTFDQRLARGFVELWGMQSAEAARLRDRR
ncbi:argininosuccinate synthase [Cenarchaeum symbiosum A]|uniref:Argininosuccinate synthase n=1 Tax=Cenarchaeum symbiosum (strain A) TaxID=414004 RepID=A0RW43_CENSY|nr:argininosuccinate synthase [Cenarchaeum symbiosum A]